MVSRATRSVLVAGLAIWFGHVSVVSAQSDEWTNEVAKRLFEEGVRLASAGRWSAALDRFERSSSLVPRASTSYNIANALYRLDRPTEAMAELDSSGHLFDPEDRSLLARRDELRTLLRSQVAEVRLRLSPHDASLIVDEQEVSTLGTRRLLRLDPGRHSLRLTRTGYASFEESLVVIAGDRISRSLTLEPVHDPLPPSPSAALTPTLPAQAADPPDDRRRFVKRPGFWVLIGVVVAAGVGAGVAIALTRKDDSPECGTTGACATAPSRAAISF
ncbi:MAG: hypothetical protein AAF436_03610 [Myxococcota bacterium]